MMHAVLALMGLENRKKRSTDHILGAGAILYHHGYHMHNLIH